MANPRSKTSSAGQLPAATVNPSTGQTQTAAALANIGRLCGPISSVTGVAPNGNMTVNIPATARYWWVKLLCNGGTNVAANQTYSYLGGVVEGTIGQTYSATGIAIVGGKGLISCAITTAATTAANGVYTLWSAAGDGSAVIITVNGGMVVSAVIGAQGGGGWINPSIFFTGPMHVLVGTIEQRGWYASDIIAREAACGNIMQPGELTFFFGEPRQRSRKRDSQCTWYVSGQTSFQIQANCNSNLVNPTVLASGAWDYQPNQVTNRSTGVTTPSYNIVRHKRVTTPAISSGSLISVPANIIPTDKPIRRLWLIGATPGQITQMYIKADGNTIEQRYTPDIDAELAAWGFAMTPPVGANNVMSPGGNVPTPFDVAFVTDPDEVIAKALTVSDLEIQITQGVTQVVTILVEQLSNSF